MTSESTVEAADRLHEQGDEEELAAMAARLAVIEGKTLPLLTATIRRLLNVEIESLTELPDAATTQYTELQEIEARLSALERRVERLGDIEREQTTKEQKMAAVLAYADNKRDAGQATIAVTAAEIKGCVGVSRRYAYELVDIMATEVSGCRLRESTTVETSTGTKQKPKAVLVDCEVVHSEGGDMNSFITRTAPEEHTQPGDGDTREGK